MFYYEGGLMKISNHLYAFLILTIFSAFLFMGCGDSSDVVFVATDNTKLTGTVASGAPIVNSTVYVVDANCEVVSGTTGADGKYSIDVNDKTPPMLVGGTRPNGQLYYTIASSKGRANLHPFTDVIARNWYAGRGVDIAEIFVCNGSMPAQPTEEQLGAIQNTLEGVLNTMYNTVGVPSGFDMLTSDFDADGTGFDKLLDSANVNVDTVNNTVSVELTDPATGFGGTVMDIDLMANIAVADVSAPSVPTGAIALSDESKAILTWNSSTDNIGIAGYEIHNSSGLLATVAFPVYVDSGLSAATKYCYQVRAFDAAGNTSAPSTEACTTTLATADVTAPAAPTGLGAVATGIDIELAWTPSASGDVIGYDVYRGPTGAATTKVASTVASSYLDIDLMGLTEYCYAVTAFDAAGNVSQKTAEDCDTTGCAGPVAGTPDDWTTISTINAPTARYSHELVWTGKEMIVWGGGDASGRTNTGGIYNGTWRATSVPESLVGRSMFSAVWTGTGMIVWGGSAASGSPKTNTGGIYYPDTDTWALINQTAAPTGRSSHAAIWTGDKMIVWGGQIDTYETPTNTGGIYDPVEDAWAYTNTTGAPSARSGRYSAVWTGDEMIVWGGNKGGGVYDNTGAIYNVATDTWRPISSVGAPSARNAYTLLWTGSKVIVWGGATANGLTNTGAIYDPATDTWESTSTTCPPSERGGHVGVWTGTEMLVWGGNMETGDKHAVWRYDPESGDWSAITTMDAPARSHHKALWTGTKMIGWGGYNPDGSMPNPRFNTGIILTP